MDKYKNRIILVLILALTALLWAEPDSSAKRKEYEVKSAFVYNFLKFIDWPEDDSQKGEFTIGIFGKTACESARKVTEGKNIKDRKIVVEQLTREELADVKALQAFQVLFITTDEEVDYKTILDHVKDQTILTIGETNGFLEDGGIVNFLLEDKKVRFEINMISAEKANLKVRSKLLRLAKRVIQE
ncbi:MAG: YfiR family protein [Sedimentisphaerales bacterium]|nr:YfiR family protein [Sedimentisphaerales bacterium]